MSSESTSIHRFQISRGVLTSLVVLVLSSLGTGFYVATHKVNYFRVLIENQRLKRHVASNDREILKVRHTQKQVASLESSLRELLGMKNKTNIVKASAIGGPQNIISSMRDEDQGEKKANRMAVEVVETGQQQVMSFEEIERYIGELKSVYMATPLGKPVRGGWITSYYGKRDPIGLHEGEGEDHGEKDWHAGIDIASGQGVPLYATADGFVATSGYFKGYGLQVTIHHGLSYSTRYGHCSKLVVKSGDRVNRGQLIAYMGSTGYSTGPHVHYEVRQHNTPINPMRFIREEW